ncbi:MAG TPA: class II aldolase/adducin family protein [Rhodothermales bacterium]
MNRDTLVHTLLDLAASIGDGRRMAILGEGNVSGALDRDRFLVKASGARMSDLKAEQLVEVRAEPLVAAVESEELLPDEAVEGLLLASRVECFALKPSVESLFHAWLLAQPGIRFVGHAHPIAVNQLLCSPAAQQFALKRLFPDHVVYCGAESVLVPYVDPGLTLARRIAAEVNAFRMRSDRLPTTILLENHGVIAVGGSAAEVDAALAMCEKAAEVFVGAAAVGGPVFMTSEHVRRIEGRIDEHYRQHMLRGEAGTA